MAHVHHFTYGPINPVVAYLIAFAGSLAALWSTARARDAQQRRYRVRWLIVGSIILGGAIWLMHFIAMIGFDVPDSRVRYDPWLTGLSAVLAVVVVGIGMQIVGSGSRSVPKLLGGGLFTGVGVAIMHYTGMAAMHVNGRIGFDLPLVGASVLIAVVAATVALWFTLVVKGRLAAVAAGALMGVAVTAMHYTGMAGLQVTVAPNPGPVPGISSIELVLPITVLTVLSLFGILLMALQAMGGDAFDLPAARPAPLPAERPARSGPAGVSRAPARSAPPAGSGFPVSGSAFPGLGGPNSGAGGAAGPVGSPRGAGGPVGAQRGAGGRPADNAPDSGFSGLTDRGPRPLPGARPAPNSLYAGLGSMREVQAESRRRPSD